MYTEANKDVNGAAYILTFIVNKLKIAIGCNRYINNFDNEGWLFKIDVE